MKTITAEELDKKFDDGEDVSEYMDFSKAKRLKDFISENKNEQENVNIYFPKSVLAIIDKKVQEIGVDRESFIKMVVAERLNILETTHQ